MKRATVESKIQKGIIKWRDDVLNMSLLDVGGRDFRCLKWLHAIPNGGARNIVTATILKAEGVTEGVWDLSLPVHVEDWHGLYMEVKRPAGPWGKKGYLSPAQKEFGRWLDKDGYAIWVSYSTQEGIDAIMRYLSGTWVQPHYSWMK